MRSFVEPTPSHKHSGEFNIKKKDGYVLNVSKSIQTIQTIKDTFKKADAKKADEAE